MTYRSASIPRPMICGVDEAGRGPVLGPLVVAAVMLENDAPLRELGVRDSKKLTARRREELAPRIKELARVEIEVVSVEVIDEKTNDHLLNELEAEVFARLIDKLGPECAYIDACDPNERRFSSMVSGRLVCRPRLVCEHKADVRYPVVSAASIIAKTVRDAQVRELEALVGEPIGTGYAHDPTTRAFLEKWINKNGIPPPQTRRSWATTKRAESLARNSRLTDWD